MTNSYLLILFIMLGLSLPMFPQDRKSDGVDNVLEQVPYASIFLLKACGVKSKDNWGALTVTTVGSWVVAAGTTYLLKNNIRERRPDGANHRSFPSAHTCLTFTGATVLHKEYGQVSPWISVAGYTVATCVGIDRVLRDRHHWHDVVVGAGLGIGLTEGTWWLTHRVFKRKDKEVAIGCSGNTLDLAITF